MDIDLLLTIAGWVTAITVIIVFLYKSFKAIKGLFKITESINAIPIVVQSVEKLKEHEEENFKIIKQIILDLKAVTEQLTIIQKEKIPQYDCNLKIIEGLVKKTEENCRKDINRDSLLLSQARQMLLTEIEKCIDMKEVSITRRVVLSQLYEAYEINNGNGNVSSLYKTFLQLPTKNE